MIPISIYSDYKCGALTDEQFENECRRMNRRDMAEQDEQEMQALWQDEDSEGGLIADD